MEIEVDQDTCVGSGQCVLTAPDVFDQRDDDAIVELLDPAPPAPSRQAARNAAAGCPAAAITVRDDARS
ncbi:ferredoxin [Pseudonocardia kunmingensis]|uniref:Ferredoxin n=1 Tax=Pseudonocardia kunmingensis TaxID=630975 RepID=A0A543DQY1_9PSEU|nr:ferredoxin [Pseudonocardia kunmingensis]TQM11730.1 ferredoxin [Pseudonocardia kunmingensis]